MRVTLKISDQVWAAIPRFDRFLKTYNLRVVNQVVDTTQGTVQVVINARLFGEVKLVTTLAHSFFDAAVLTVSNDSGEWTCPPV